MSKIGQRFRRLRDDGRTGLVTYVTAGDPSLARTPGILRALDGAGADVLEVGVPFSDPLADGPVIQRAAERALAGGATLRATLEMVQSVRASIAAPIVIFSYVNPIFAMGVDRFAALAAAAGVDGVLTLDLPIEEAHEVRAALIAAQLDPIFLVSPTTTVRRIRAAAELSRGFLYGISRLGVTGARDELANGAAEMAARIRAATDMPLALGFGVSKPEHVAAIGQWADAAVVGSGLVRVIEETGDGASVEGRVAEYVGWLRSKIGAGV